MTDTGTFGSGLNFGEGGGYTPVQAPDQPPAGGADVPSPVATAPQAPQPAPNLQQAPPDPGTLPPAAQAPSFGSAIRSILPGPQYTAPDPQATALDQTADTLQQRIKRANDIAANPMLQMFNPEGVQAARQFLPQATEQLQKIRAQKADMQANRTQADTLGLAPGEVPDEASAADRVAVASSKALKGDLKVFKGLQAVDPKAAEAIQDQVYETVGGHLTKAQYAFDSLAGMQNQGQYTAKLEQLRKDGTLTDLEALGLKVPGSYDTFSTAKGREAQALREARIGVDTIRQKLEDRNTYQPMEEKEAKTYSGRLTTAYGDQITNGTWGRNGAAGTRGLVVNGMADPRDLGKNFTLATPEQRTAIKEEFSHAVPKEEVDKYRAFNRTYELATTDSKGNKLPDGKINTNPNVQQGIAEGLASMLRGGGGGATAGLLNIESSKRAAVQTLLDKITANYAGGINALTNGADPEKVKPYLTQLTQGQIRDVMDALKAYNGNSIGDRVGAIAQRAGALGLDTAALGLGKNESGVVADAIEAGRQAQIARMLPNHQAIGGGDGVLQLGAQRPGAGATATPAGTGPATQLPGAQPLQTPVQQATMRPGPPSPGGGSAPVQPVPPAAGRPPQPAGGGAPAPVAVAGQSVNVGLPAGASPNYVASLQRIETGGEKDPWRAGAEGSSAGGAFQFINSTWKDNKPAGAPDRARDATPQQQAEALATYTAKNATTLQKAGLPVDDTNLYIAHNVGAGGATALLRAAPNADARTIVGEDAAKNNPLFFKGKPTVATVLGRYQAEVAKDIDASVPRGDGAATAAAKPGLLSRINSALMSGLSPQDQQKVGGAVADAATDNAPAIGSTLGAVAGGAAGGPAGAVAGGAAGGTAGQALKDYLKGNDQSPVRLAKEGALGGVLGVGGPARPIVGAIARAAGAGAVEAGATAAEGGDAGEVVDAGLKGVGMAAGGEAFGRALGMGMHKMYSLFTPSAQKAVRTAASDLHAANETLKSEAPTLPGANGTSTPNPAYEAAQAAKDKAEATIKEMMPNAKPEEVAYAHKVSSEGVPKQEAQIARPGELEKQDIGAGYQQLENEVGKAGIGKPKAAPKLPDGPLAAVENKQVSASHAELAEHVEMAITAPAANWQEKWTQLKDARSDLLKAERDARTSTSPGRTKIADDMRTLADTVRTQQEKAAKYVFGEKDGEAFMGRLKVLDTRYRNLMDATFDGDLAKAAALKGDAGRMAQKKFEVFAHDDPQAIAAYRAMRGSKGDLAEATVPWTVAAEGLPVVGKVVKVAKLASILRDWARERTAGSPVSFADMVKTNLGAAEVGRNARDVMGTAVQRGVTMQ